MDLSIIIVNFNGAHFIKDCLESVFQSECHFDYEVIVVDNDSKDNSLDVLASYQDKIVLIKNNVNVGFARANNIAMDAVKGHMIFLLNNDTELKKDTLQISYDFVQNTPKLGALSPKLLHTDGSLQCPGSVLGHWRFKKETPQKVPFIAGAAVMMKRSVFEEIGYFDENYFFYNDDIDLCKMLAKHGYDIYYLPTASLIHHGGLSTRSFKLGTLIEGYRGGLYFCYKHYPGVVYFLYRVLLLIDLAIRLLVHVLRLPFAKDAKAYLKTYLAIVKIDLTNDVFVKKRG